jgi:N-acetylmuramoyl-L-alanine amidase
VLRGLLTVFLLLSPLLEASADPVSRVTALRFGGAQTQTRIVIDSDKPLTFKVFVSDQGGDHLIVDLPKVRWSIGGLTAESGSGRGEGLVDAYRYAHNTASSSRLVLDLDGPARLVRSFALPPAGGDPHYRIVLDLKPSEGGRAARSPTDAASATAPPSPTPRPRAAPSPVPEGRRPLIVIDPGHGGRDPGAISARGVMEKDVTLEIARMLRDELIASGRYRAALTRSKDEFIELEARVERARALGATLFISLHADAGPNASVRGASVYTLSAEGEKRAEEVRHRNDWILDVETDASRPPEVNDILADLVQRETKTQSARFAQMLIPALSEAGWPALANTHRKRGFFVLLSPDVPAVLLEMGFMTHPADEKMLVSASQRARLAEGILAAIDAFFAPDPALLARQ